MAKTIPIYFPNINWQPEEKQLNALNAFDKWAYDRNLDKWLHIGARRIVLMWHRQCGKDEIAQVCLARAIKHTRNGYFWYCFPTFANAMSSIGTVGRLEKIIPKEIMIPLNKEGTKFINESTGRIKCINGNVIQLLGSDNYRRKLGATLNGVIFSEYQECNPEAYVYIKPMIDRNKAWSIRIGTPEGDDHLGNALDNAIENMLAGNTDFYGEVLPNADIICPNTGKVLIEGTDLVDEKDLEETLMEFVLDHGLPGGIAKMNQQYQCDRKAASVGAFFGPQMQIVKNQRIHDLSQYNIPHPNFPIHTAWDVSEGGGGDYTVGVAFQVIPDEKLKRNTIWVIDYIAKRFADAPDLFRDWAMPGRRYCRDGINNAKSYMIVPWDFKPLKTYQVDLIQQILNMGIKIHWVQKTDNKEYDYQILRQELPFMWFDDKCTKTNDGSRHNLIEALATCKAEMNVKTYRYLPVHEWNRDFVDAMRYLVMGLKEVYKDMNEPFEINETSLDIFPNDESQHPTVGDIWEQLDKL